MDNEEMEYGEIYSLYYRKHWLFGKPQFMNYNYIFQENTWEGLFLYRNWMETVGYPFFQR